MPQGSRRLKCSHLWGAAPLKPDSAWRWEQESRGLHGTAQRCSWNNISGISSKLSKELLKWSKNCFASHPRHRRSLCRQECLAVNARGEWQDQGVSSEGDQSLVGWEDNLGFTAVLPWGTFRPEITRREKRRQKNHSQVGFDIIKQTLFGISSTDPVREGTNQLPYHY